MVGRPDGWRPAATPVGTAGRVEDQIRRIRLTLFALGEAADGAERAALAAELGRRLSWTEEAVGRAVEPVVAASMRSDVRRQLHQERHELRRQLAAVRRRARRLGARATADPGLHQLVDDLGALAARHLARLEDEVLGPWRALQRPERQAVPTGIPGAPLPGTPAVAGAGEPGRAAADDAAAGSAVAAPPRRAGRWFAGRHRGDAVGLPGGVPAAPAARG